LLESIAGEAWLRNSVEKRGYVATRQKGFSLIELLIVVAIILIIAAIAVPNLLRSRMQANETSAVASLRSMNTAAVSYNSTWGNGYPPSMAAMGNNGTTSISCTNGEFIDVVLTGGTKSGYTFQLSPGLAANILNSNASSCSGGYGYSDGYMITSVPVTVGTTGQRSFCTDASGVIRYNSAGTVNAGPSPNCAFGDPPLQ
jgi:type IV pilus assembly protein PilA